jgi:TRAP-type C4-dicarboxylate transport system permease small subunit
MSVYGQVLRWIGRLELFAAAALVAAVVIAVAAQVVARYGFGAPFRWVEEFGVAALVWITVLAGSLAVKEGTHVRLWSSHRRGRAWALYRLPGHLLVVALCLAVIIYGQRIFAVENLTTTTSLPIDIPRGFIFSGALIFGFASILLTTIFMILCDVAELLGQDMTRIALGQPPEGGFEEI